CARPNYGSSYHYW
nr:immunoglobulin heavy chain junction region [Mus musculus]NSM05969.1 immunoglobulin heavy chain junction region [Mus musculus]NSM07717.1 immunoglobulin heavy chain junction region [Mus musculus]